ncbi:hypothetical protein B0T26DRAFT_740310 [Lasiosphaeria miniovina]|uniref:SnoaL-like domain-containing protein n=1 Tax=Lasiosphaeria miniovina TaxID=1954250 RepID=A0AA40E0E9_9PEZI|nr:uncharacterized protein B0T26DRAFT_740310 [Lasiosphaeria miniovina]KAK0723334.1 hypothetical protein B0T26DRAFT_740310 [Lasiosphaeria miniovina]
MSNMKSLRSPNTTALLRYLYSDVRRISDVASPDIILHPADRRVSASRVVDGAAGRPPLVGLAAAQAHEDALVAATRGTLRMDVQGMIADAHFGAVLGVLRATRQGCDDLAVPFCGVWRFVDGWAVEHWENAADPAALARWLQQEPTGNGLS